MFRAAPGVGGWEKTANTAHGASTSHTTAHKNRMLIMKEEENHTDERRSSQRQQEVLPNPFPNPNPKMASGQVRDRVKKCSPNDVPKK